LSTMMTSQRADVPAPIDGRQASRARALFLDAMTIETSRESETWGMTRNGLTHN
jgi:hypothetical protein